jgi:hypothetical protein
MILELAAEVRWLLEAEIERDFFYGFSGKQQTLRGNQTALSEPNAG